MQINETSQLCDWINKEIVTKQLIPKFDALFSILNANSIKQNNQPAQPFEDQKTDLIDGLMDVNINILSLEQLKALETLGIKKNIGSLGKEKINKILSNNLDIAHVANEINTMKDEIQNGINIAESIKNAIRPLVTDDTLEIDQNKVLTRIIFDHDAAIYNIKNMKEWTSKWFDIGRGFAVANGQTPEDIEVIGATKGSLIIELALLATTALPIAKAINLTLDSMVKYRDYQLKSVEVRSMKSDNPKLENDFEEDAKRWEERAKKLKSETAEEITEDIKQYLNDFREENQAELGKAVRTLVDFLSKGGEVDCVIPEDINDIDDEENKDLHGALTSLRDDFVRIRHLKETLLIEDNSKDGE